MLSLAAHAGEAGRALLREAVSHPNPEVAAIAVHGLVGEEETTPQQVVVWLEHPSPLVRLCVALPAARRFGPDTPEPAVDVLLAALHADPGLQASYGSLPFVDGRLRGAVAIALSNVRSPRAFAAAPTLAVDLDRLDLFTLDAVTQGLLALCFGDGTGPFAPAFLQVLEALGRSRQLRSFGNFDDTARRWNLPTQPDELSALVTRLRVTPDPEAALRARMIGE
ncbi:MAG: HEAT repeat domain-containing protein [Myxococcota bacterium]